MQNEIAPLRGVPLKREPSKAIKGELVDDVAETMARHAEAQCRLNASFSESSQRVERAFDDVKYLSRALVECMEIRTLKRRQAFVLSVFDQLNSREDNKGG